MLRLADFETQYEIFSSLDLTEHMRELLKLLVMNEF
jgi:hypothetical protein